jgi:hypothetical protein
MTSAPDSLAAGTLEVGINDTNQVYINHPRLDVDANGVGHIVFSTDEALDLGMLLIRKANEARRIREEQLHMGRVFSAQWSGSAGLVCIFVNGHRDPQQFLWMIAGVLESYPWVVIQLTDVKHKYFRIGPVSGRLYKTKPTAKGAFPVTVLWIFTDPDKYKPRGARA